MGGAYVFPGGRVDQADADSDLIARARPGADLSTLRSATGGQTDEEALAFVVAAVRETLEESGVLLADGPGDRDGARARRALEAGSSFSQLCRDLDLTFDTPALVPFARWVTPIVEQRRYDARFFVAIAPSDEASHDRSETVAHAWMAPSDAVAAHLEGTIDLPPPTLRTLEELAPLTSAAQALDLARSRPAPFVCPIFSDTGDGVWVLALPGDPAHTEPTPALPGPTRFTLRDGRFVSG